VRIWKEAVIACLMVLHCQSPAKTRKCKNISHRIW